MEIRNWKMLMNVSITPKLCCPQSPSWNSRFTPAREKSANYYAHGEISYNCYNYDEPTGGRIYEVDVCRKSGQASQISSGIIWDAPTCNEQALPNRYSCHGCSANDSVTLLLRRSISRGNIYVFFKIHWYFVTQEKSIKKIHPWWVVAASMLTYVVAYVENQIHTRAW